MELTRPGHQIGRIGPRLAASQVLSSLCVPAIGYQTAAVPLFGVSNTQTQLKGPIKEDTGCWTANSGTRWVVQSSAGPHMRNNHHIDVLRQHIWCRRGVQTPVQCVGCSHWGCGHPQHMGCVEDVSGLLVQHQNPEALKSLFCTATV